MKKIFLTTAMISLLGASVYAFDGGKKTEKTVTVSYAVENQFETDFDGAKNVVWAITDNTQKAVFTLDNVKMTAFYSLQNEYLGVTKDVDYSEVTDKAKAVIADKYKDYAVNEVIKLQTPDSDTNFDQTAYFVDLKSSTNEVLVRVTPASSVYFFKQVK